jgi:hypothetical protein
MKRKRTVSAQLIGCRPPGGSDMSTWWWVPIGLIAWGGLSLAVGLLLGRVFRRSAQTGEALDAQKGEAPTGCQEPPQDGPCPA